MFFFIHLGSAYTACADEKKWTLTESTGPLTLSSVLYAGGFWGAIVLLSLNN